MNMTALKAGDIMQMEVVKTYPYMTLRELAKVFVQSRISGAPVVDEEDRLLGVVSLTDLMRYDLEHPRYRVEMHPFYKTFDHTYEIDMLDPYGASDDFDEKTVEDIMTGYIFSLTEEASIADIGRMMLEHHIHRVIIADKNRTLKGIVTTMDLVRVLTGIERGLGA